MTNNMRYILLVVLFAGARQEQVTAQNTSNDKTAESILQKTINRLKEFTAFEYDASFKMKYFDQEDTMDFYSRHCRVIKKEKDTVLKYHGILSHGNIDIGYLGDDFFVVNRKEKWMQWERTAVTGKSFIRNNIGLNFVPGFIYAAAPFENWIRNAKQIGRLQDLTRGSKKYYVIRLTLAPDEEITKLEKHLYIDQQTMLPSQLISYAEYKGIQQEYQELILKNLKGSRRKDPVLTYDFSSQLELRSFAIVKPKEEPLLPVGSVAPGFSYKDIISHKKYELPVTGTQQLMLLDFWYLACAPCLKAIPELVALQKEFGQRGLQVVGINNTDTTDKKIAEIKKFIPTLQINYPLLLANKSTATDYKVTSWPTLYLVQDGRVIFSSRGYIEEEYKKLRSVIEEIVIRQEGIQK